MERGSLDFQYSETEAPQLIKVVGVGGGGGNAVNKMCTMGTVPGVSFLLCNTDAQALSKSAVPERIVIGPSVTQGLGAGNKPERARAAAEESHEVIQEALTKGDTRMVFITAGMGGGPGTGAAPVIGRIAMQAGLLTIGIVTIPFLFEGKRKILQALDGVKQMRQSVDALLVVNNQRLIEIYADYTMDNAFEKADDTLSNAARGISDMVNAAGKINLDFADVETTLRGGGVAVINTGYGEGPGRVMTAINDALNSPLLNNNSINQARHLLINVYQSTEEPLTTKELSELSEFTETFTNDVETIFGYAYREDLGPKVAVTILASGFDFEEEDFRPGISKPQDPLERIHREGRRNAEDDLIRRTYGDSALIRPKVEPIALLIDELDDEELLLLLEETPSIQRNSQLFYTKRAERSSQRTVRIAPLGSRQPSEGNHLSSKADRFSPNSSSSFSSPSPQRPQPSPASASPAYVPNGTETGEEPNDEESKAEVIHFSNF